MAKLVRKNPWRRAPLCMTAEEDPTWLPTPTDTLDMRIPLTSQNTRNSHDSDIADDLDPSHSGMLPTGSARDFTLGRLVGPQFTGWRFGVFHFGIWACIVFVFNLTATIWGSMAIRKETGVFFEGECAFVKRLNTGLHVLINVLGAILLAGSNYTMQCMSSPTRKEIDQSHTLSPFIPLQIGVPGIRNLSKIKRHRVILWCLLGLSSAPLHLL